MISPICFHTSEQLTSKTGIWGHVTIMCFYQNWSFCWRPSFCSQHKALLTCSSSADQGESSHHIQSGNLPTPRQHLNKNVTVYWGSPHVSIASKSLLEEAMWDPAEGSVSRRARSNSGSGTRQNWKVLNGERSSSVCITLSPAVLLVLSSVCLFDCVWSARDDRRVTGLPAPSSNVLDLHVLLPSSDELTPFAACFLGRLSVSSESSR